MDEDSLDIDIQDGDLEIVCEGEDGMGCIQTDSRESEQYFFIWQYLSMIVMYDPLSCFVEVQCSTIVAKTRPCGQDVCLCR